MKSNKLFAAFGNIDDSFISEDANQAGGRFSCLVPSKRTVPLLGKVSNDTEGREKAAVLNRKRVIFRVAGLAACAAVLLLCALWAVPMLLDTPDGDLRMDDPVVSDGNPGSNPDSNPDSNQTISIPFDPENTSIAGLPAGGFSLAELHNNSGEEADRMLLAEISDFFSTNPPYFVFARVIETVQWVDTDRSWSPERQTSVLHVLSTIWSDVELPETISVTQSKYGGCHAGEGTNLLRAGGVYLLPLWHWQEADTWIISGDLDVLFEVDDQGRIWSHSSFYGFNQFDGQDWSVVADIITEITSDENFASAVTSFGRIARDWGVLAEITVISAEHTVGQWGNEQVEYRLKLDDVWSVFTSRWYSWGAESGDEIIAIAHGGVALLDQGGRYLLILDPSEGGPYINIGMIAGINNDGTISAQTNYNLGADAYYTDADDEGDSPDTTIYEFNVFKEFDGYTVSQMSEEAARAKQWHERYVGS